MYLLEIATLSKNVPAGRISYWCREPFSVGDALSWSMRKKVIVGIVLSCNPLGRSKQFLKSAEYTIREFTADYVRFGLLTPDDMATINTIASSYLETPERVLQEIISVKSIGKKIVTHPSVYIFPTKQSLNFYKSNNPDNTATLVTIDAVPIILNAQHVVIQESLSSKYYTHKAPFLSRAWIIAALLRSRSITCVVSDYISLPGYPADANTELKTIPYGEEKSSLEHTISESIEITKQLVAQGKNVAWWYERTMGASSLYCSNCGNAVQCTECGLPTALSVAGYKNSLHCKHCGHDDAAIPNVCPTCTTPLIIRIPGIDAMRSELERQELFVPLVTSKDIETIARDPNIDIVLVPLLRSQLERPMFSVTQDVYRSLAMLQCSKLVYVPTAAQPLLASNPLPDDYHMRQQLGFPPFGSYLKLSIVLPKTRQSRIAAMLAPWKFSTQPRIIAGASKIVVTIDSQLHEISHHGRPADPADISQLLFDLKKLGVVTGKIYPTSPILDLPFF